VKVSTLLYLQSNAGIADNSNDLELDDAVSVGCVTKLAF